ncbi:hypothetical protein HF995_13375 [Sanguibacter hominis ATCC BAA-789]|uniref:Uncharacterized protein n=1 Tax=Sanguibacter hominis ATCC BAA-789 TaxID=1312740 RepID=A0A9X5IQJ7_9MICO|nr:hypothetical protein [Sanguibacter hominis]NKX94247.1 hypothetical protein [Sanguibacter hominis ATCC BAA-789]
MVLLAVPATGASAGVEPGLVADHAQLVIADVAPGHPGVGTTWLTNTASIPLQVTALSVARGDLVAGGLTVTVQACSAAWVHADCPTGALEVAQATIVEGITTTTTTFRIEANDKTQLRVEASLPSTVGNEAQARSASVTLTWAGIKAPWRPGDPEDEPAAQPTVEPSWTQTDPNTPKITPEEPRPGPGWLPRTGPAGTTTIIGAAAALILAGIGTVSARALITQRRRSTTEGA